jgi:hypothetical protein
MSQDFWSPIRYGRVKSKTQTATPWCPERAHMTDWILLCVYSGQNYTGKGEVTHVRGEVFRKRAYPTPTFS